MIRETSKREGSLLALVMVMVALVGVLVSGLAFRSVRAGRTAGWGLEHLDARLLAESAADELFLALQRDARSPEDRTFRALTAPPAGGAPVPLPWLKPERVIAELAAGGRARLLPPAAGAYATLIAVAPTSPDRGECAGLVRIDVAVRTTGRAPAAVERVIVERAFHVSRAALPRLPRLPGPAGSLALYVGAADRALLPAAGFGEGPLPALFVPAAGTGSRTEPGWRSMASLLERHTGDGLRRVPAPQDRWLAGALAQLAPEAMSQRAQFVTSGTAELSAFLAARRARGGRVDGVIHDVSGRTVRVDLGAAPFRGHCVISATGPIELSAVRLADPARDMLTIVSAQEIVVRGGQVDAALACVAPGSRGVTFARRARVLGPIFSSRFPRGQRVDRGDLEASAVSSDPLGAEMAAPYVCAWAPHPVRIDHGRE